jgi:hypothetical protein
MGEMRNAHKVLVGKPERQRPFGRYRSIWENNTELDPKICSGRVWTGFVWFRIGVSC